MITDPDDLDDFSGRTIGYGVAICLGLCIVAGGLYVAAKTIAAFIGVSPVKVCLLVNVGRAARARDKAIRAESGFREAHQCLILQVQACDAAAISGWRSRALADATIP